MASVTLQELSKRFDKVTAVHQINLEIPDKEFVVFVGPSGCGKTTTLRMIAGLEETSDGTILIGERVVNDVPPKDRNIAMVFQNYALYPHMDVYKNMAFGLKLRRTPKPEIDRRVREASRILGIEELLDRKPRQLSGGQRQRVAVGRAIVRQPEVFLFDEPLSNLDAKLRVQMRSELIKLHYQLEATMIYVTHDQVEAMTMGDRIAVMRDGLLQQVGTPPQLYTSPINVFVAAFIGSPAMNFATVRADDGKLKLGSADLELTGRPAAAAAERKGKDLLIGFRPEDLEIADAVGNGGVRLPAKIEVVEYLGNQELLHADAEGNEIVALVPSERQVKVGERVDFVIPSGRLHLFDPETEESLV